jgi:hypothetical protein
MVARTGRRHAGGTDHDDSNERAAMGLPPLTMLGGEPDNSATA